MLERHVEHALWECGRRSRTWSRDRRRPLRVSVLRPRDPSGTGAYDICQVCFWEDDGQDDGGGHRLNLTPAGQRPAERLVGDLSGRDAVSADRQHRPVKAGMLASIPDLEVQAAIIGHFHYKSRANKTVVSQAWQGSASEAGLGWRSRSTGTEPRVGSRQDSRVPGRSQMVWFT